MHVLGGSALMWWHVALCDCVVGECAGVRWFTAIVIGGLLLAMQLLLCVHVQVHVSHPSYKAVGA